MANNNPNKKRRQQTTKVTGIGVLSYPFLNKPRQFQGKGDYYLDTKIMLHGKDAEELIAVIDEERAAVEAETGVPLHPSCPYAPAVDSDGNEVPGAFNFKTKLKAVVDMGPNRDPWVRTVEFLDANAQPVSPKPMLASGTKARLKLEFFRWKAGSSCGVTPQPVAVQIIELVEYSGQSNSNDFGKVEGGYVAPPPQPGQEDDNDGDSDGDEHVSAAASGGDF